MMAFTTVKRPTIAVGKKKYPHVRVKNFYRTANEEYPIPIILRDAFYCQIKTEDIIKGRQMIQLWKAQPSTGLHMMEDVCLPEKQTTTDAVLFRRARNRRSG